MLNPEILNFPAPKSSLNIKKFEGKVPLNDSSIVRFNYGHLVNVILPDTLKLSESVKNSLINDCEYYKIEDLVLSDLLDEKFIACFVKKGKLRLLALNSRIDCDNFVAITPNGQFVLTVDKVSYNSLGFDGKSNKLKTHYSINIDLKLPQNKSLKRFKAKLKDFQTFDVILMWEPPEETICPSSVAKYFSELNYAITTCIPQFKSHIVYSVKVPLINFDEMRDFLEWLGMVAMDGDLKNDDECYYNNYLTPEPNVELGQVRCLTWRGFFTNTQIKGLIKEILNNVDLNLQPWVAIYVQGFTDCNTTWDNEDNNYLSAGDNGYVIVFNNKEGVFCIQKM